MSDPRPRTPLTDPLLGTPYRSLGRIGRGGMGEVLAAEHVALGKRVVVKLLHEQLVDRPDHVDRMRLEAQALARLAHPNLVVVHDYGRTADGRPYMVMEELVGRTLRAEIKERGRLPPAEAIGLVRQTLAGLAAAHAVGIVHRDVKLDNLFVCGAPGGARTVKVLDFGIAKVLPAARRGASPAPLAFPTEEGVALGTPRYFAPEQARGNAVDARADLYSAGLVLYALIAGRGPFDHHHAIYELALAQVEEVPEPPSKVAGVPLPAALEAVVMRALAKRPEDRFQSATELSDALARVLAALEPAAPARPTPATPSMVTQPLRRIALVAAPAHVSAPAQAPAQVPPRTVALAPAPASPPPRTVALAPAPASPPPRTVALAPAPARTSTPPHTLTLPSAPRALHAALPFVAPPGAAPPRRARVACAREPDPPPPPTRRSPRRPERRPPTRLGPVAFAAVVLVTATIVATVTLGLVHLVAGPEASASGSATTTGR